MDCHELLDHLRDLANLGAGNSSCLRHTSACLVSAVCTAAATCNQARHLWACSCDTGELNCATCLRLCFICDWTSFVKVLID